MPVITGNTSHHYLRTYPRGKVNHRRDVHVWRPKDPYKISTNRPSKCDHHMFTNSRVPTPQWKREGRRLDSSRYLCSWCGAGKTAKTRSSGAGLSSNSASESNPKRRRTVSSSPLRYFDRALGEIKHHLAKHIVVDLSYRSRKSDHVNGRDTRYRMTQVVGKQPRSGTCCDQYSSPLSPTGVAPNWFPSATLLCFC